jgi:hypothetical protein
MTINVSEPIENEGIHNTPDGADHHPEFVTCPECSMIAALQYRDRVKSTDGPIDHVKMFCVNRHWFFMPINMLNEHPQS